MKSRPKVAVVGLGIGRGHAAAAAKNPKADLTALCDTDKQRLAANCKEFGVKEAYTDYKKMLRQAKPDIVVVALPNVLHAPVTVAAINAGAHVLCEKPMAMNTQQAQKMADTARAKKKKLMIDFSYRFMPEAQALKNIVDTGAVGDIYYARTTWHRTRGIPWFGPWFSQKDKSGGGPLIDLGVHRIDLAMWLMGNPKPVTASGSTYDMLGKELAKKANKKFDVEDLALAMVRFDNGATMLVDISWAINCERSEEMASYLYGTKAGICHRNVGEGYKFEAYIFGEWDGTYVTSKIKNLPPAMNPVDHFIDVVTEGTKPIATTQHGVDVMKVLDGIYKSARLGKEIRI